MTMYEYRLAGTKTLGHVNDDFLKAQLIGVCWCIHVSDWEVMPHYVRLRQVRRQQVKTKRFDFGLFKKRYNHTNMCVGPLVENVHVVVCQRV